LYEQKKAEIRNLDTTVSYFKKINVNLNKEISAQEKKEKQYKAEVDSMDKVVIVAQVEKQKAVIRATDQQERKIKWRGFALGEAGFIIITVLIVIIIIL
jgi:septal ring factor EnvC (AmiA/AmiB activator)